MADYAAQAVSSTYAVDAYSSIFEPDVLLPSQFFLSSEDGIIGGERKLMAAILADGVEAFIAECIREIDQVEGEDTEGARDWVETRDSQYVFSFDNVCQSLGIEPEYLRLGLARYIGAVRVKRFNNGANFGESSWKKIRRPRK